MNCLSKSGEEEQVEMKKEGVKDGEMKTSEGYLGVGKDGIVHGRRNASDPILNRKKWVLLIPRRWKTRR